MLIPISDSYKHAKTAEAELNMTRCLHMTLIQQLQTWPASMINWIYCVC